MNYFSDKVQSCLIRLCQTKSKCDFRDTTFSKLHHRQRIKGNETFITYDMLSARRKDVFTIGSKCSSKKKLDKFDFC